MTANANKSLYELLAHSDSNEDRPNHFAEELGDPMFLDVDHDQLEYTSAHNDDLRGILFIDELDCDHAIACRVCWEDAYDIAQIAPNVFLVLVEGKYALIGLGGHRGEQYIEFSQPPIPYPLDEQINTVSNWHKRVAESTKTPSFPTEQDIDQPSPMLHAYRLISRMIESGYSPDNDESPEYWLYKRAALALQMWQSRQV